MSEAPSIPQAIPSPATEAMPQASKPAPAQRKPGKREIELDFVRGIAIILVLDYHSPLQALFWPFTKLGVGFWDHFGWTGVDLFFVLSGFLVGGLLVKEWLVRGAVDAKQFLIRRGFKIWPQYYVFLIIMLLTGHRGMQELWGNFLNIQNYTGGGPLHTWSLAVEEHAYLLLTFGLMWVAHRRMRTRQVLWILIGTIALVSVTRMIQVLHFYQREYWATHTRIDGILYGVVLALLYHTEPAIFRRIQSWRWLWIALIVITICFTRLHNSEHQWAASFAIDLANWASVGVLLLCYHHREGAKRSWLYRAIAWVGLYSYGIYLWHVSMVAPIRIITQHLPHWPGIIFLLLSPYVSGIVVGVVMTKLVEFPMLRLRDRLFPRKVDSAVGVPAEVEAEEDAKAAPASA